jgi:hypothetical protein
VVWRGRRGRRRVLLLLLEPAVLTMGGEVSRALVVGMNKRVGFLYLLCVLYGFCFSFLYTPPFFLFVIHTVFFTHSLGVC